MAVGDAVPAGSRVLAERTSDLFHEREERIQHPSLQLITLLHWDRLGNGYVGARC